MDDEEVALAAKLEELRVEAVSQGVEWLRRALSEISRDELRALAAAGGVQTQPNHKWLTVAELRSALMEVLAPPTEVGCVKKRFLTKVDFFRFSAIDGSLGATKRGLDASKCV